ncbi:envelope glycoprotein [Plecturocebus cupreus]
MDLSLGGTHPDSSLSPAVPDATAVTETQTKPEDATNTAPSLPDDLEIFVSMGTQMDIDKKLEAKLNALEQTVTVLGDKVYNMQSRMTLRCHVDFKYICVTNTPYNDTEWSWPLVKAHLQGIWSHNNLSLDVLKLQQQIHAIDFSRQELPRDATIAHDIVDTLSSWTRGFHLPSLSIIISIRGCVLLLIILLPFLFRLVFSSLQQLQLKLSELHLKTKKEGNVGIAPA